MTGCCNAGPHVMAMVKERSCHAVDTWTKTTVGPCISHRRESAEPVRRWIHETADCTVLHSSKAGSCGTFWLPTQNDT